MNERDKKIVELATNFVITILSSNFNTESLRELCQINYGNKMVLLDHLIAIHNITGDAIQILGGKYES